MISIKKKHFIRLTWVQKAGVLYIFTLSDCLNEVANAISIQWRTLLLKFSSKRVFLKTTSTILISDRHYEES